MSNGDSSIFLGPVRVNKVTKDQWLNFKQDFVQNRNGEKFEYLRLGQAFIIYMTEIGTIDPDLFYQSNDERAERYILEHFVE